jgi:Hydantoin racemase
MAGNVTIAAFYTARTLVSSCSELIEKSLPRAKLVNIVDEGFIGTVIEDGCVSPASARRLLYHLMAAQDAGADFIFETCSSVGDAVESARPFLDVPIVRIDESMALAAVRGYSRIAVLATLPTTLGPTKRLIESRASREGRRVEVLEGLAAGAFQALQGGDRPRHDALILQAAESLASKADAFVLAQASMSAIEAELRQRTGKPILSSMDSGVAYLKSLVEGSEELKLKL